jgi:hypothetical protein
MKIIDIRWIPGEVTDDLRQMRVAKCRAFLRVLEAMQGTHFHDIVTGDES